MRLVFRLLAAAFAGVVIFVFAFWTAIAVLTLVLRNAELAAGRLIVAILAAACCTVTVARWTWRHSGSGSPRSPRGLGGMVVGGALVLGIVGFACGFFGPLILTPRANQGPLLGILVTGPLGVLIGAIGGGVYWKLRSGKS